jgi:hypothetical protein
MERAGWRLDFRRQRALLRSAPDQRPKLRCRFQFQRHGAFHVAIPAFDAAIAAGDRDSSGGQSEKKAMRSIGFLMALSSHRLGWN